MAMPPQTSRPPRADVRLYVLADTGVAAGRDLATCALEAARGGATLIQLRDKREDTRALIACARAVQEALAGTGVAFLVNDRVDVALAAHADGVHLGQSDMHPCDARALLGPDAIIGLTVKNTRHVAEAPLEVLDYLAVGGVFETSSKDNPDPPVGLDGLARLVGAIRGRGFAGPVCAIAGITLDTVPAVIAAGADGICVVSAVIAQSNPAAAARALRTAVDAALAECAGAA